MIEDDLAFYRRRLDEERTSAARAPTPEIASAHRLLATLYGHRLEDFAASETRSILFKEAAKAEPNETKQPSQKPRKSLGTEKGE